MKKYLFHLLILLLVALSAMGAALVTFEVKDEGGKRIIFGTGSLTFPTITGTPTNLRVKIFDDAVTGSRLTWSSQKIAQHTTDSTIHFTAASLEHQELAGAGFYNHSSLDAHVDDPTIHFTAASLEHQALAGAGFYNHSSLDAHVDDPTIHFTAASLEHQALAGAGFYNHSAIDAHVDDPTIHVPVFDNLSTSADTLWSSDFTKAYVADNVVQGVTGDAFDTIQVSGQPTLSAFGEEPLELVAGANITIFTNATSTPMQITINSTGGGGGNAGMITEDTTCYVATTGNDTTGDGTSGTPYATPHKCLNYYGDILISSNAWLTVQLADGYYNFSSTPLVVSHLAGNRIKITGENTYTKSITSVQSVSGSAGNYDVTLNLSDADNIVAGDFALIKDTTGGTNWSYIQGVHPITNVGSNQITFKSKHRSTGVPSGAITGTLTVAKSILHFYRDGITLNQSALGGITKVVVETTTGKGIYAINGANLIATAPFGVSGGGYGIYADNGALLNIPYTMYSGSDAGLFILNSRAFAQYTILSGNLVMGILAEASTINTRYAMATGNGIGFDTERFAYQDVAYTYATGNGTGYKANYMSLMYAYSTYTTGNTVDFTPSYGSTGNYGSLIQ